MGILDRFIAWSIPFVPRALVKRVSARYIAGTTLDDAIRVVKDLNTEGYCATLDVLGEHIFRREEAEAAVQEYLRALDRLNSEKLDSNISVKLTMLGLKLDFDFCLENLRKLVKTADEFGNFVRIDMEDSSCTTDTLRIFRELRQDFDNVGFVIQAYMRRSLTDVRSLMNNHQTQINVRVCKGIYIEPREIAYKDGERINSNYTLLLKEFLQAGHYVGVATHDEKLVRAAYDLIDKLSVPKDRFEFQMLLGVDEPLRQVILKDGYKLRVYVPYGQKWYEYSVRRLKENPKIAGYVLKNMIVR
ncbi:MAG: proline dehydrogenase family protein [bacterium]